MINSCNIYFGRVVDVNDEEKIFRVRAVIDGYTDEAETENLPWYYPFFGIGFLPQVDDVIPILIFDGNFVNGFYNNKVDLLNPNLEDESDYVNYLEVYKRNGVSMTYKDTLGIQFINDKSEIQIEKDRISHKVDGNLITMNKDRIDIGNTSGEATPLGDKTVKAFDNANVYSEKIYDGMIKLFKAVEKGCKSPHTKPIKIALALQRPLVELSLKPIPDKNKNHYDKIQSKKTYVE